MGSRIKRNVSARVCVGAQSPGKSALASAIKSVNEGLRSSAYSVALGAVVGGAMLGSPVIMAQSEAIEEVTVMGIRASLKRAMDTKRDAKGIVDAISADDIGKFPDTNLAESLQRITGVSIDRSRGEGSRITVRGLGPDFNLVTFNGRQLPTQSGAGRSFDFANIASEGIAGVEVFKSGNATLPTGGIGATVNVITTKPLDSPGLKATAGVKLVHDTSTEIGDSVTPEYSGLFSTTLLDDTVGIALSASFQRRDSGENSGGTAGWFQFPATAVKGGKVYADDGFALNDRLTQQINDPTQHINRPSGGDFYAVPRNTTYNIAEFERERINGQLTLQWQPIDSLRGTIDYTYAELDLTRRYTNIGGWYLFPAEARSSWTNGPDNSNESALFYSEQNAATDFVTSIGEDGGTSENKSLGFNLSWQPNDRLSIGLDYHESTATFGPNSEYGTSANVGLLSNNRRGTTTYFNAGDLPVLELDLDPTLNRNGEPLDPDAYSIGGSVFSNAQNEMEIKQATVSAEFQIDDISSIDFGVQLTKVNNQSASTNVQRGTWAGVGDEADLTDILSPGSIAGAFDQISGGDDPRMQTDFFTSSLDAIVERANLLIERDGLVSISSEPGAALTGGYGDCGTAFCANSDFDGEFANRLEAQEDTISAYVQYNISFDTAMPINLYTGLRYEETEVDSPFSTLTPVNSTWVTDSGDFAVVFGDSLDGRQTGSYQHLLPNVDINIEPIENVKTRVSFSKTVTRPSYGEIQGGLSIDTPAQESGGTGSRGNPGLLPYTSTNWDFSVEWYFTDESYFSVTYFTKDVENYIGSFTEQNQTLGLATAPVTPIGGALYNEVKDALEAQGKPSDSLSIRTEILANYFGRPEVNADAGTIQGAPGDPELTFDIATRVNTGDATIDGWEIALQHPFGDSGFGMITNITFVDSSVGYDNRADLRDTQFVVTGLSDSANLIAYYDKEGLQARIAYNWRDSFLNGIGHSAGTTEPNYTEEYGQWDFSASYDVSEFLTVFVEGINITDETTRSHGRTKMQVLNAAQTGARYNFGARIKY